jgi:DNA repair protein RadC
MSHDRLRADLLAPPATASAPDAMDRFRAAARKVARMLEQTAAGERNETQVFAALESLLARANKPEIRGDDPSREAAYAELDRLQRSVAPAIEAGRASRERERARPREPERPLTGYEKELAVTGVGNTRRASAPSGPQVPDCRTMPAGESRRVGTIHDPHTVYAYLAPKSVRLKYERAWLLLLSPEYYLVNEGQIGQGDVRSVEVDLDWALACVRKPNTPYAVLAHNHPNGQAWPSEDDANLTRSMQQAARRQGVTLLDHVVLGRDQYFSFREANLWQVTRTNKTKS